MALTITKLKMWKDPGYTRGCLEVPPAGSKKLPAPDYTLAADETLRPHKGSTLTELHLPLSFTQTFGMSYLYIEATDGAGSVSLFGWITSIDQRSTAAEGVTIRWDVDWWRSYSGAITWGTGTVIRCNDPTYKRPYPTQPRMWKVTNYEKICRSWSDYATYPYWVVVIYTVKVSDLVTAINTYFWQANFSTAKTEVQGGNTYYAVPLDRVFEGSLPGLLGLNPDQITSIYICPHPPASPTWNGSVLTHSAEGKDWFAYRADTNLATQQSTTFLKTYESNDMKKAVIVDPTGAVVYTLPWGYSTNEDYYLLDSGTVGCNLNIQFRTSGTTPTGVETAPLGKTASLPCISAPLCSNGWSSYVYSGQRAYDMEVKSIQREENAVSGLIGMGSSALGGGIGGAMAGKGAGAGIGAAAGALGSIIGTAIQYDQAARFNDMYQKATDKLHSNQVSTVLQSAGGIAFLNTIATVGHWYIVQLEADDTSAAEYSNDVTLNGYETDIPTSSVSSFITGGGPLQIINLNLTGNAPPAAKQFIKSKLESGVHITEKNPSGVVP